MEWNKVNETETVLQPIEATVRGGRFGCVILVHSIQGRTTHLKR
jgi:hypothetical protein